MSNGTVQQQKVHLTLDGKVVTKNVLDLTLEEQQRISGAIDTFLFTTRLLTPNFDDAALQQIIEKVDVSGRPADDSLSYVFANNELRREARRRMEDEIKAREQASQSLLREEQRRAEREEYLQPSNRAEVARQLQVNQPHPVTETAPPVRQWTDEEIDAMSSDDMVRYGIVTRNVRVEERQCSTGYVSHPQRTGVRRERRLKIPAEQLASEEYRKRVLAQDEAERRKVKADIQRALEEQQRKAWEEREKKRAKRN